MRSIRVSDIGVDIRLRVKDDDGNIVNISSAMVKRYDFAKPNGTTYSATASFVTDGSEGLLYYQTLTGEIDQEGIWELQLYLELSYGKYRSTKIKFKVEEIIVA